jgi:hypothetical protein
MIGLLASTQQPESQSAESLAENETTTEERSHRGGDTSESELSKDQAFDVLRNSRRRAVISCLRARGGVVSVKELSKCVAAAEYDVPGAELSSEQYKRVYTGLYQCHLGRMEELGVLEFDTETNRVRLREAASQLDPYLDETGRNAARIELGAAIVVASIVVLGASGVGLFGAVSGPPFALLTIAVLLALALFQLFGSTETAR